MQIRWVCVDLQTMVSFEVHKKCRTRVLEGLNWILQPLPCPENCAMLVLAILLRRLELYRPILRFFGLFHKIRWDLLTTYNIKIRKPNSLLTVWYALRTMDTQREKKPSLHGRKFNPNPKFFGTAEAYFVCHIGPIFQISLIYAFIGCP